MKLSEFHTKDEYYWATIINTIKQIVDGEPRTFEHGLIKLVPMTEESIEDEQEKADRLFMSTVLGFSKTKQGK